MTLLFLPFEPLKRSYIRLESQTELLRQASASEITLNAVWERCMSPILHSFALFNFEPVSRGLPAFDLVEIEV
jgi:hypothetical protein